MSMINLVRNELLLSVDNANTTAQGGNNMPCIIQDNSQSGYYDGWITTLRCGYFSGTTLVEIELLKLNNFYYIPDEALMRKGPIYLAAALISPDGERTDVTNRVSLEIKAGLNGGEILPSETAWQEHVDEYVRTHFANLTELVNDLTRTTPGAALDAMQGNVLLNLLRNVIRLSDGTTAYNMFIHRENVTFSEGYGTIDFTTKTWLEGKTLSSICFAVIGSSGYIAVTGCTINSSTKQATIRVVNVYDRTPYDGATLTVSFLGFYFVS